MVCVRGSAQHVTDAVNACSGRQCVLKRSTFCFEFVHELFGQCPGDETTNCASGGDASDSSEWLESAVNLAPIKALLMFAGILPCAKMFHTDISHSVVSVSSSKIVWFICAPSRPWGRSSWCTPQARQEHAAVQSDRLLGFVLKNLLWNSTLLHLGSSVLEFMQRFLCSWSQRCACEALPSSGHFTNSDFLASCLGPLLGGQCSLPGKWLGDLGWISMENFPLAFVEQIEPTVSAKRTLGTQSEQQPARQHTEQLSRP